MRNELTRLSSAIKDPDMKKVKPSARLKLALRTKLTCDAAAL